MPAPLFSKKPYSDPGLPVAKEPVQRGPEEYRSIGQAVFALPAIPGLDPGAMAFLQSSSGAVDALYNLAAIQNPEAFGLLVSTRRVSVTPGASTGTVLHTNNLPIPVVVHIRAQSLETGTSWYLYLAKDDSNATTALAPIASNASEHDKAVIVPPGSAVYGRMLAQDGDTAARNIIVFSIPLTGRGILNLR